MSGDAGTPETSSDRRPSLATAKSMRFEKIEQELQVSDRSEKPEVQEKQTIIDQMWFQITIGIIVGMNTATMGFEADYPEWRVAWSVCEHFFTSAFVTEAVLKIFILGHLYFCDLWNCLDFFLVMVSVMDRWVFAAISPSALPDLQSLTIFRLLRLLRLLRVGRLIRSCRKLRLVVAGVVDAIETMFWVGVVLLLAIYVGAVLLVGILGKATTYPGYSEEIEDIDSSEMMQNFNPSVAFGSMSKAMLTLFNISILAEWTEVVRPIMVKQPWLLPIFLVFVMTVTLGIMNVIIGMIADSVMGHAQKLNEEKIQDEVAAKMGVLNQIQSLVTDVDSDNDGIVTFEDLEVVMADQDSKLQAVLASVDLHLPTGFSAEELLLMVDQSGDGVLEIDEFTASFYRLIDSNEFQKLCLLTTGINSTKRLVKTQQKQLDRIEDTLAELARHVRGASGAQCPATDAEPIAQAAITVDTTKCVFSMPAARGANDAADGGAEPWRDLVTAVTDQVLAGNTHRRDQGMLLQLEAAVRRVEAQLSELLKPSFPATPKFDENKSSAFRPGCTVALIDKNRNVAHIPHSPELMPKLPTGLLLASGHLGGVTKGSSMQL